MGEGDIESAKKGVGNAIVLVTAVSILLAAVFLIGINPILDLFGATDVLRPYALQYGTIIGLGLPFMMIPGAINSMIRADGSPKYAMFSMALGILCYDQELIQKIAARAAFTRAMCRMPARTPPAVFWPRPSPATSRATAMPTTSGRSSIRSSLSCTEFSLFPSFAQKTPVLADRGLCVLPLDQKVSSPLGSRAIRESTASAGLMPWLTTAFTARTMGISTW